MGRPARLAVAAVIALGVQSSPARADPPAVPASDPAVAAQAEVIARHARDPQEQDRREKALDALGKIGGAQAAAAACAALEDPFGHVRDQAVSALIAMLKGKARAATREWLETRALVDRERPGVRSGAAIALGVAAAKDAAPALAASARRENDAAVLVALADALARGGDPAAADALAPLVDHPDGRVACAAARALGRTGAARDRTSAVLSAVLAGTDVAPRRVLARAGAVDGLAASDPRALLTLEAGVARDRGLEPRIALADALPALADADAGRAFDLLDRLLGDPAWQVRAAAVQAALLLWRKEVVPVLVARLRAERGRLVRDVEDALATLAGEDLGADADLWEAWWRQRGPSLDLGPRPKAERGRVRRRTTKPSGAPPDASSTAAFFRLPIRSARLAFVLDLSGSMRHPVEGEGAAGETRVAAARREFARTAAALGRDTAYDVFVYRYPSAFPPAPAWTRALGALTPGGERTARRATAWLEKEEPRGWGAFYDALVLAAAEDVDTVVLLSDGVPSRGTYARGHRLIDEFVEANRFRRVAVDTVFVGRSASGRAFMEDLAAATGGRFQDATEAPR